VLILSCTLWQAVQQ